MSNRSRRLVSRVAFLVTGLLGLAATAATAQPLGWTVPAGGETWTAGTSHTVIWNGGSPSWSVNVYVLEMTNFTTVDIIALGVPNSGQALWNIPAALPPGPYCVYVEDFPRTTWAYSQNFNLVAPPQCGPGCALTALTTPAVACGQTQADAEALATALAQAQIQNACPASSTLDPSSITIDLTLLAVGPFPCPVGTTGAYAVEASVVACCCTHPVPTAPRAWTTMKTLYR